MKITFDETDNGFWLDFTAETVEDAVLLARFGLNCTKEIVESSAYCFKAGSFSAYAVLGKRKQIRNTIKG